MSGKRSSIPALLVAGVMFAGLETPAANAAPTWLALIRLPLHGHGLEFGGARPPVPQGDAVNVPPAASEISEEELCDTLVSSARARALPVSFFTNLIWQESRFDARAVSRAGAQGIAQFMPAVSKEVGLANPFDPRQAIPAAARLLRTLVNKFGNLGLAAAAYNAGPRRVREWIASKGKLPPETRAYVAIITGRNADTWRGRKTAGDAVAVASAVPCHRVANFAAANKSEQAQVAAQLSQEASRLASHKAKPRTPASGGAHARRVAAARASGKMGRRAATARTAALTSRERSQKKG